MNNNVRDMKSEIESLSAMKITPISRRYEKRFKLDAAQIRKQCLLVDSQRVDWHDVEESHFVAKQQLGEDRVRELGDVFQLLDHDQDGMIEMNDVVQMNRYLRPNLSEEVLNQDAKLLFQLMDKDHNEKIDKNEWLQGWMQCVKDGRRSAVFVDHYLHDIWNAAISNEEEKNDSDDKHVPLTSFLFT